ncbi:MAG TPA: ABC transporter permease [Opitutales bacterium]|nr:ABC transporter permease [Opitutales bacterium]
MNKSWLASVKKSPAVWPLAGLLLLGLINLIFSRNFFTVTELDGHYVGTLMDIFKNASIVLILGVGMTLVIATGGIDLSVGSVMAIVGATAAVMMKNGVNSLPSVIAVSIGLGALCGLVNGLLVSWARIQPIVATLILMVAGRGISQLISGGDQVLITNEHFNYLGNGFLGGIPLAPILATVLYLAVWIWLRRSATGLFIEAAGDNETASRFAGLATGRVKCLAYVVCGICAAMAGLLEVSYIRDADPLSTGQYKELDAIFAVVIGGTALSGGRFNLLGTYLGAILLQTLTVTMLYVGVSSAVAPMPKAVLIIAVCLMQSETTRRWLGRKFRRAAT